MHDLTVSNLSPDQRVAFDGIMSWLNRGTGTKRTLTLGGYAGSGKSTVVSVVAHELLKRGPVAFCAFTGKASSVLGRKLAEAGIQTVSRIVPRGPGGIRAFEPRPYCGTIHGLVYRPCDACMVEEEHEHTCGLSEGDLGAGLTGDACLACNPPKPERKSGPCPRCNSARYFRRDQLDRHYALIVVDEASMVSDDMLQVLLSYGTPILAVGDHGQLPPVRGQGSLMRAPELRLEKIHRQAEGNPIIALSAKIRQTGDIDDALEDGSAFTILARRDMAAWIGKSFLKERLLADPRFPEGVLGTVLVSWTNKLRVSLNHDVREALGIGNQPPKAGEAVICLKNDAPVYNGMRGVLVGDAERWGDSEAWETAKAPKWRISVDFVEDGQRAENVLASDHQFFAEKTIDFDAAQVMGVSMSNLGKLYDFSYAVTCHKMQGSQAHEVIGVIEPGLSRMSRDDRTRWIYTMVTRAQSRLVVVR